tara:strand:- start:1112 stop:1528 length:417 start_codon:yes stop_codon:yes gene_type:complete
MAWGKSVKRNKYDKVFSDYIRTRDKWTCQRCGKYFPESSSRGGLHCSHYHGRRAYATRFCELNCEALCYGCHSYLGSHPEEHRKHKKIKLGRDKFNLLMEKKNKRVKRRDYENPDFYKLLKMKLEKARGQNGKGKDDK